MKKDFVREAYIEALKKKLEKAKSSYEIAKKDTIEAEGRMVTRYDSTKTETAWLADGYLKEVKELEQQIEFMEQKKEFANIGDLLSLDLLIGTEYQGSFSYELSRTAENKIPEKLFEATIGGFLGDSVILENENQQMEYQIRKIEKHLDTSAVFVEALVTVEDEYGDSVYYIVNYLGGMDVYVEGVEIFCISKQTPIAKALLGRKKGEQIFVSRNQSHPYTIKDFE